MMFSFRCSSWLLLLPLWSEQVAGVHPYVRRLEAGDSPPLNSGGLSGSGAIDVVEYPDTINDQEIRNGYAISPLPWYAVFLGRTICGGSLIHGDIVLTAAHCVDDNGFPPLVRVGANNFYNGGIVTSVIGGILHPEWKWDQPSNPDLAVLVLRDYLPNQVAVLNANLSIPAANQPFLFTMGFGLFNDKEASQTLLGASIPYLDDCAHESDTYNRTRHLCADSQYIASCGGDSGSPVTLGLSSSIQVGINSYSNGKCSSQTLDVYTRISFFHAWIQQQICEMSANPPAICIKMEVPTTESSDHPTASPKADSTEVPTSSATLASTSAGTDGSTSAITLTNNAHYSAATNSPTK